MKKPRRALSRGDSGLVAHVTQVGGGEGDQVSRADGYVVPSGFPNRHACIGRATQGGNAVRPLDLTDVDS